MVKEILVQEKAPLNRIVFPDEVCPYCGDWFVHIYTLERDPLKGDEHKCKRKV